jgi:hypothetical protein
MKAIELPSLVGLLRYAVTSPTLLGVLVASLAARALLRRAGGVSPVAPEPVVVADPLEKGLVRTAQMVRAVIEVGIADRLVSIVARVVTNGARAAWLLERGGLDYAAKRTARAVTDGAVVAHRSVEEKGLEGMLQRTVLAVQAVSQALQRWHTGQLRRNLVWIPIALALAVVGLVVAGW